MQQSDFFPSRQQLRLRGFDYAAGGYYFVTTCTDKNQMHFGRVMGDQVLLSDIGTIIQNELLEIGSTFTNVRLDQFIVMPNHVHAIFELTDDSRTTSLGRVVGTFKGRSLRQTRHLLDGIRLWQRSYYDRIIRDDAGLIRIREYITNNPINWYLDIYNPNRL